MRRLRPPRIDLIKGVLVDRWLTSIGLLLLVLFLSGCATTTVDLVKHDAESVRKIALITRLSNDRLQVFDQTGPKRMYVAAPATPAGIAAGLVVGGVAKAVVAGIKKNRSLSGDPNDLQNELGDSRIDLIFDSTFMDEFGQKFEIVAPQVSKDVRLEPNPAEGGQADYSPFQKLFGADSVLVIDYQYGLAAYDKRPASAAISADVSLISVGENRVILHKSIFCDTSWRGGHTVSEYKADNARLFKEEIAEDVKGIAGVLVVELTMAPSNAPQKGVFGLPQY